MLTPYIRNEFKTNRKLIENKNIKMKTRKIKTFLGIGLEQYIGEGEIMNSNSIENWCAIAGYSCISEPRFGNFLLVDFMNVLNNKTLNFNVPLCFHMFMQAQARKDMLGDIELKQFEKR